jgi:hypothetical protein
VGVSLVAVPEVLPQVDSIEARAETDEEAGERFYNAAVRYVQRRKPRKALEFFERALPFMNMESDLYYNMVMVAEASYQLDKVLLYGAGFTFLEPDGTDTEEIQRKMKRVSSLFKKRKESVGEVSFRVKPRGVEIFVRGVPVTTSGGPSVRLAPGTYNVSASMEDYNDYKRTIMVKAGVDQTVKGTLKKKIYFGKLKIVTKPEEGVDVLIDGKKVGVTPVDDRTMETGRYLVRFEKEGWDYWHRYVEIERDATYELTPKMERTPPGVHTTR